MSESREVAREESKVEKRAREKRLERSIEREWHEVGYTPTRHITGIAATGDAEVLTDFARSEFYAVGFPSHMARRDIEEIRMALWRLAPTGTPFPRL